MTMQVGGIEFDVKVDASGVTTATTKSVEDLNKLQKKLEAIDPAAKKSGSALTGMGRNAGMAGIQIQQFVGQIQGGQNAMLALSQQSADLGFVLGMPLLGAVTGLAASFAGILLPSLFDTEDKTQDLIDKLRELSETKIISKEQAALLAQEERKLIKEKEALRDAAAEEIAEQERLIKVMRASMARNADSQIAYENYQKSIKEANEEIVTQKASLVTLNEEIGESGVKLDYYRSMMEGATEQTTSQIEEVNNLVKALEAQADAIGKTDRQIAIKAATEEGANETQLAAINAAYDLIEADEARVESVKRAAIAEREAIKTRIEGQKNYESLLDEMFDNQVKREEEEAKRKEGMQSGLDALREELMTEEQLRADAFLTRGEQLREALENELLTKQEFDALDKERVEQHRQWLIDKEKDAANQKVKLEQQAQAAINSLREAAINNAIGLLDQFAGESKAAAVAAIALSKGVAIAQAIQNTGVAVMKAYSVDPYGVLAAKAASIGSANVAMIAATGLAQAAGAMSGSNSASTYSNGVPATNTTSSSSTATGGVSKTYSLNFTGNEPVNAQELADILNEAAADGVVFKLGS